MICCICTSSYGAAGLPEIQVDPDTHEITITGMAPQGDDSSWVTLKVMKPGYTQGTDISDETVFMNMIDNVADIDLAKNKAWKLSYTTTGKPGKYSLYVMYENSLEPDFFEDCITIYPTLQDVAESLSEVQSSGELADLVDLACEANQIPSKVFCSLDVAQKQNVTNLIYQQKDTVDSTDTFTELLVGLSFVEALSVADSAGLAELALSEYAAVSDSLPAYEIYTDILDSTRKNEIITTLKSGISGKTVNEAAALFNDAVILKAVKNAFPAGQIKSILEIGESWIGIDFGKYQKHTNQGYINSTLAGRDFSDMGKLKDAYDEAVSKGEISKGDDTPRGGGGGGSIKVEIPAAPEPEDDTKNEAVNPSEGAHYYNDLADCEWARESIEALSRRGIVNGVAQGVFAPHSSVKREEFLKLLVLALLETDENATAAFADVPSDAWYYPYVANGVLHGITGGMGDGKFGAGLNIRREDLAVMVYRAIVPDAKDASVQLKTNFADYDLISDYAREAVAYLSENGIITGNADGTFAPDQYATRAQAACIIHRLIR